MKTQTIVILAFLLVSCTSVSAQPPEPVATISPEPPAPANPSPEDVPTITSKPTATLPPEPVLGFGSKLFWERDGMTMIYVPEGSFEMGSNDGESDEMPVHAVTLDLD